MAMESAASTTARARRILNGAKAKQKETWDELFQSADKDRSKMLDIKELKTVLREKLNICEAALSDFEIQTIHSEIDSDQSGVVDWQEFLQFVARGPKRPEDEAKLFALRTKRVHRNMRLAFNKFQTDQSAVQKLFEKIDKGCDRKISIHELLTFVRSDLKLTQWDVFESELKAFYKTMDSNGDGIDVDELLLFIRKTRSTFQKGNWSGMTIQQHASSGKGKHCTTWVGGFHHGRWPGPRDHETRAACWSRLLRKVERCLEEAKKADMREEPPAAQRKFQEAARMLRLGETYVAALCGSAASGSWDWASYCAGLASGLLLFALIEALVTLRVLSTNLWMSREVELLRAEVGELREEVDSLSSEVRRLRRALAGLRVQTGSSAPPTPERRSAGGGESSDESYSVVSRPESRRTSDSRTSGYPPRPVQPSSAAAAGGGSGASTSTPSISWREREEICDQIGLWVRRCIEGDHRESSGRDRIPLGSKLWLVFRDIQGIIYDPPLCFRTFAGAKALCKRGADAGDSVFVGLPSEREAVRVVREIQADYPLGKLVVESADGGPTVRVICVAEIEGKILVCIPSGAWHRLRANRALAPDSLSKVVQVEVAACREDDRQTPVDEVRLKVWMGFFTEDYANMIEVSEALDPLDHDFSDGLFPYALALKELATEHFAFFSAGEQDDPPPVPDGVGRGSQDIDGRMEALEHMMGEVLLAMKQLPSALRPKTGETKEKTRVSFAPDTKFLKARAKSSSSTPSTPHLDYPDLDPSVVTAALQAGISEPALEQMQALVQTNKKRAGALRPTGLRRPTTSQVDVLSEEEDEPELGTQEQEQGAGSHNDQDGSIVNVLSKLTDIVDTLTADKQKKTSKLEQALDGVASVSSESGSLGGKRSAAARRHLRAALNDSPAEIYALIERLMEEDMMSQTIAPGMTNQPSSARAWVEHRSRIGPYKAVAHAAWGIAGVIDALRSGKVAAARARANLLLLQLDQSSVDRGNWTMAADLSLEMPPPFSTLSTHQSPDLSNGELPYSRLLDHRWAELTVSYIQDQDSYLSKRKSLGKARPVTKSDGGDEDHSEPKRKAKAKPKPKAASAADP
eukprot:s59_g78.t1